VKIWQQNYIFCLSCGLIWHMRANTVILFHVAMWNKSNPCYRPGQALRIPESWAHIHMKVVRLSALCTGCLYLTLNIAGTHFCQRLSRPQGSSVAGRIMSMKNSSDVRNRTCHLPAYSTVPQPTALPCAPM
jgi:hypothetical protein